MNRLTFQHLAALLPRQQKVCCSHCEDNVSVSGAGSTLMAAACKGKVKIINVGSIEGLAGGLGEGGCVC